MTAAPVWGVPAPAVLAPGSAAADPSAWRLEAHGSKSGSKVSGVFEVGVGRHAVRAAVEALQVRVTKEQGGDARTLSWRELQGTSAMPLGVVEPSGEEWVEIEGGLRPLRPPRGMGAHGGRSLRAWVRCGALPMAMLEVSLRREVSLRSGSWGAVADIPVTKEFHALPQTTLWTPRWVVVTHNAVQAWLAITASAVMLRQSETGLLTSTPTWPMVIKVAQEPEIQASVVAAWRVGVPPIEVFSLIEDLTGRRA